MLIWGKILNFLDIKYLFDNLVDKSKSNINQLIVINRNYIIFRNMTDNYYELANYNIINNRYKKIKQ